MSIRYSEEKRNQIIKRAFCGESLTDIAEDLDIKRTTLYVIKRSNWWKEKEEILRKVVNETEL